MVSARIRAVLFDFAGVITMPMGPTVKELAQKSGADLAELVDFMFGDYGGTGDTPWHRLERGQIDLEDFGTWGRTEGAARGWDLDLITFLDELIACELRTDIVQRVGELRGQGYRTLLLTNNIREYSGQWRAKLPVDELFEFVIDSSEVGMRKPEPRIFQLALDKLGVAPGEAVMLDDIAVNVEAARSLGMHAIHVGARAEEALAELDELLGRA
ncbi:MAG TPA: HAD family phosphatase [Pseudonocardia sp.]|nr:HAD family phosphatase [Pseudonocardia sp.]